MSGLSGVEWSGVEWSGVESSGLEWSGVEWSGVEWSVKLSGVEWWRMTLGLGTRFIVDGFQGYGKSHSGWCTNWRERVPFTRGTCITPQLFP